MLCFVVRLLLAILLFAGSSPGLAKLYKWTDENGQVHYSQTPPPDLEEEMDEVQIADDGLADDEGEIGLKGGWWALTPRGIRTLFLDNKRFTVHRHTGKQLDTLYLGQWEMVERRLTLRYTHDLKGGGREGESEDVIINRFDRTRMVAAYADGRTLTYLRRNGRVEPTEKSKTLMGVWTMADGQREIVFKAGEFEIRKKGRRLDRFSVGNWTFQDYEGELILEYVYDLEPRHRLMGQTQNWRIRELDPVQLILSDDKGRLWRMSRERPR
jgi:hypothetical protein